MFDLPGVQAAIRAEGIDGWLLYDFRGLNVLARRVLHFPADAHVTRRWFYFIPANGPADGPLAAAGVAALAVFTGAGLG